MIGLDIPRIDAESKVTGEALYPGDLNADDMLHMKILWADRPHARVVSIDTSEAIAHPGVVAVFTAADVPNNEYGLVMPDQPVLCGPGSSKQDADIVRTTMDQIAVIVAETVEAASAARDLIKVRYDNLPGVFDPFEAMSEGAPQLHRNTPNNILAHYRVQQGDMEAAWAEAEVVVEGTYHTTWQEHAYLQPEAGLSYVDDEGRVTVVVAGQDAHEDLHQICHALELPAEQVRVRYAAVGVAFGGREDMSVQIVLALATHKLRRPVKIVWSREESTRYHHKRHPITVKTRWGARRDGSIIAVEAEVVGDAGAYAYTSTKVLANATLMVTGPYRIPNVQVDTYTVYTNNLPAGAFRGFGGPQGAFAAETQINRLAVQLAMDPVDLRLKNVLQENDLLSVGTPLPAGINIGSVIEACALNSGWQNVSGQWRRRINYTLLLTSTRRRGVGFAVGYKNVG
ncbi:MAG: molybdopterin-dependent oxidoreductase, partial [Chloroflexi bacterium]|nr:molybdopterin-dependent oxidoreductase [Chloroflexota bacterium]